MDRTGTSEHRTIREGTDVLSADGGKVGEVVAVQPTYVVVEKGFFFPTDYYIPLSAVATYATSSKSYRDAISAISAAVGGGKPADGEKVYLSVTKDEAITPDWDAMPTDAYATTTTTYDTGTTGVTARPTADLAGEALRVPVHEEELTATKREREVGAVAITKDVVAEERVLEVPVTDIPLQVVRRLARSQASSGKNAAPAVVNRAGGGRGCGIRR